MGLLYQACRASQPRNLLPLPLGEGCGEGHALSIKPYPLTRFAAQIDLSPWERSTQAETRVSFLLDATGLDELRPFFLIGVDEGGIVFRRARRDLGTVKPELLLHLIGAEGGPQFLVEPV